jgi:hypothetical protein
MPDQVVDSLRSKKLFDTLSGTVLRLFARVQAVEAAVDKLTEQFAAVRAPPPEEPAKPPRTLTGIDMAGHPVRFEPRVKRPIGRPKGSRDAQPRQRGSGRPRHHNLNAEVSSHILDRDWDSGGG